MQHEVTITIPDALLLAEPTDAPRFAQEVQRLVAIKLYEQGQLSSGRAAALAGMSRVEFLLTLGQYQVVPFAAELEELERTHAQRDQ
ncbi:MAG: UPF0175 family protein [Chloroflexia bacterium]|nr:UPF0175 family protein [Chloroflexia bacterium]